MGQGNVSQCGFLEYSKELVYRRGGGGAYANHIDFGGMRCEVFLGGNVGLSPGVDDVKGAWEGCFLI